MPATISLDNLISATELSHGGVGRTLDRIGDGNPVVVMRNNRPAAVVITPDDYHRYTEAEEDLALYLQAADRDAADDGTRYSLDEALGGDYRPVDDGYEPEFE